MSKFLSLKPKDIIALGTYPQAADGNGKTPVLWRVLENKNGSLFLLSEKILDCKKYHFENAGITWRDCGLRKWLNGYFYNSAFSNEEKELIKSKEEDFVFLLSESEAIKNFDADGKFDNGKYDKNESRLAAGTDFAVKSGLWIWNGVYDGKTYSETDGRGKSVWGLKDNGATGNNTAADVSYRGIIRPSGREVICGDYGVRPAIILNYNF